MSHFPINYTDLDMSVNHIEKKVYKLSEVKDRLVKVAFDVVRFKDSDTDDLWQIQSADDGEYIVAKYDMEETPQEKVASAWSVLVANGSVNIFYKGYPITKFASKDADAIKSVLPNKLATDKMFVKAMLNSMQESDKARVVKQFPELV